MSNSRVLKSKGNVITQKFKPDTHKGIDIVGTGYTSDYIVSHSAGEVVGVRSDYTTKDKTGHSYGNYVKIKHPNGMYTLYAHLKYGTVAVKLGDVVETGSVLGYMGTTGHSTGVHLHFEVRDKSDTKIDPTKYINDDLPGSVKADEDINQNNELSEEELIKMANDVILGKYGNGNARVKALGDLYEIVQTKANEIVRASKEKKENATKNTDNKIHTVKKGENLSSIAKLYNTTWRKIYNDNKDVIDSTAKKHNAPAKFGYYNYIYVGEKLVIK